MEEENDEASDPPAGERGEGEAACPSALGVPAELGRDASGSVSHGGYPLGYLDMDGGRGPASPDNGWPGGGGEDEGGPPPGRQEVAERTRHAKNGGEDQTYA